MRITVAIDGDARPSRELVDRAVTRALEELAPPEPEPGPPGLPGLAAPPVLAPSARRLAPGSCRICGRLVDDEARAAGWDTHPDCADGPAFWNESS